jgi:formate dehydrogenase
MGGEQRTTFCRICEPYCGLVVEVEAGRMTKIRPDRDNPHSKGHICVKGSSFLDVVYDPDRVTRPLRRTGPPGVFEPVSWDEAMDDIAARLAAILRRDGPDGVANYKGNPLSFNTAGLPSLFQFLAHFGVWKTFGSATQDVSSRMLASALLYGAPGRFPIPDLPRCDFLLVFGANPLVSQGSLLTAPRIREDLQAIAGRGRVVVVDPRRTETAERFEHVSIRPDTDAWLIAAMIQVLFDRGRVDLARLAQLSVDAARLGEAVREITPARAERHCGVPADQIEALALAFAAAPRAAAYGRVGLCRGSFATLANVLLDALNVVAGKFATPGGLTFGDNPVDTAASRAAGAQVRETRFGTKAYVARTLPNGLLADEILEPGVGRVRALLLEAGNLILSAPGGARLAQALDSLDLMVAHDLYVNETNRYAHYILPASTFLERPDLPMLGLGHMVRPFVQFTEAVIPPVGEARDEHQLFNELGRRLHDLLGEDAGASGYAGTPPPQIDPHVLIDGLLRVNGAVVEVDGEPRALSLELLRENPHGLALADGLACTDALDKVVYEDRRIRLWRPELDPELERLTATPPPAADELRLFGMRRLKSMNSWLHNVERLVRSERPELLINPADAAARGICDGDLVRLTSDVAWLEVPASVTSAVRAGSVCYPHGWRHQGGWRRANRAPGQNINALADPGAGEQISGSSLLDGVKVRLTRAS